MRQQQGEPAGLMRREVVLPPGFGNEHQHAELSTDLLPTPPIDVGDDVQQWFGQVPVAVEGVVPPTNGYVGEVPARGQEGRDVITAANIPEPQMTLNEFLLVAVKMIPMLLCCRMNPKVVDLPGPQTASESRKHKLINLGFMHIPAAI